MKGINKDSNNFGSFCFLQGGDYTCEQMKDVIVANDGYNYKYKAERAGTIRFYISANVASILTVTNNRNSTQRTTDADAQTDASGTYVEMEVQAGDEIIIIVGAAPDRRNKFPAVTINWYGKYI